MSRVPVIAIDGPVGSGKGTISTSLAARLGWHFMDSGALYRLVAIAAIDSSVDSQDFPALASIAENLDFEFRRVGEETIALLSGKDVSYRLRTEVISAMASKVAAVKVVRAAMIDRQRAFAQPPGLVADGRDMGTIIFPDAKLKIFLTASVKIRARRRYKQLKDKGESVTLPRLFREIELRDERDMTREIAPLKPAKDAVIIDSTEFSIDQVLDKIYEIAKERFISY
ncbi:MAG: cytidylate kinase [Rhodothermales bacterium]